MSERIEKKTRISWGGLKNNKQTHWETTINSEQKRPEQAGMLTQLQWFDGEHKIVDTVLQQWVEKYLINEGSSKVG